MAPTPIASGNTADTAAARRSSESPPPSTQPPPTGSTGSTTSTPASTTTEAALKAQAQAVLASLTVEAEADTQGNTLLSKTDVFALVKLEGPNLSADEIIAGLRALRKTLSEVRSRAEKRIISVRQDKLEEQHQKNIEKANKIAKQMKKHDSKGLVSKILGWVGASIALIAATVATIATAGATAPLLVMAIVGMGMMTLEETGAMDKIMEGMTIGFSKMLEGMGVDADKAKMVGGYLAVGTIAVVLITANLVAAAMTGGANSGELATTILQVTRLIQEVTEATTLATKGGVDIAAGADQSSAIKARGEQSQVQAEIKENSQEQDQSLDDLKRIADFIKKIDEAIAKILAEIAEGQEKLVQHLAI
ncbi:MAG: type III secretion system translocon subunit SctE [Alphaproteobacteria bacterium GM202ARS2]|nr:type III secretion system translocon subunit SctE [Alphaproteobacteria bacterium GM202ARS2]